MKVLLACEESQSVCKEFRKLGHQAFSCDVLPTSGDNPEWHIQDDVFNVIKNDNWDMMIAFPPCTHLAVSGARHFKKKIKDGRQKEAIEFFKKLWSVDEWANIKHICIENPVGVMSTNLRPPDQIIHPYYFGDPYSKKTCLWLKNLSTLVHISELDQLELGYDKNKITHTHKGEFVTFSSGKRMAKWYHESKDKSGHLRSKTFPGIAKAIAEQFSKQIEHSGKLII